jgi:hypothetical protein
VDVGVMFGFRLAGLRGRARRVAPVVLAVIALITLAAAVVPAFVLYPRVTRNEALLLLPLALVGVLVVSTVSAAASGGGRELLARDQSVAFPVSPTTDHLGALLMIPLNIAWLLQCWAVLGLTSYGVGARPTLVLALLTVVVWLAASTAVAQLLAWGVEWVRRGPRGGLVVSGTGLLLAVGTAALALTHRLNAAQVGSPTLRIVVSAMDGAAGRWWPWLQVVARLVAATVVAVVLGAWAAARVARRPPRDELRAESSTRAARADPASDLVALMRTDRASIWRSVPMRRGMGVLGVFPGAVAVVGGLHWDLVGILPGLVASGGALLFGVNAWCLDGRGALWRDSLPVSPRLAFTSRALVLVEILLAVSAVTVALASLRAGVPTLPQMVAVACAAVVVAVQVVATSLRWSVRAPYAADLRSARATPAPPLVMVGYSSRLAVTTTFTGLLFTVSSHLPWSWSLVLSVPFLAWSLLRLSRTATAWADPLTRARVVATVAV